ncbi:50S ribosomal protein L23 [Candidatus Adlerbacteria bacterium RIFCSPHIGHO2_12_FULL_53_18]|uniref:Large ribosomal subunit protein uL23 n=1 Tax=Candidatus Adlerbacteria bacterium RIFCSPHIGHO2_12_FULL_53_18 TaxID=1797242 RepID=A0A1F4XS20_9BACT|nr:MAG: 50S ribosomal protein L23 [Candidatus Adlerbacteria bacterium RIFCSPHIGHO2_12_FULL_53_18]
MKKHTSQILISPRITEKGAYLSALGAYVFNISEVANKHEVAAAVQEIFKVTPRKVTIVRVPRKQVMTRGSRRMGMTAGGKKAYVFLKKGESIDLA